MLHYFNPFNGTPFKASLLLAIVSAFFLFLALVLQSQAMPVLDPAIPITPIETCLVEGVAQEAY